MTDKKEETKYLTMINYGAYEGWSIQGEYKTLEEAVKEGIVNSYGNKFMIVQKVNWKPTKDVLKANISDNEMKHYYPTKESRGGGE